jgi:hypothetical protein
MGKVRGVIGQGTSRLGKYTTTDGAEWSLLALANRRQRSLNAAVKLEHLIKRHGLAKKPSNCNLTKVLVAMREKPALRRSLFIALNY